MGAEDDGILRACGLVLTDSAGRERMKLELDAEHGERPRVVMFDAGGRERVAIYLCLRGGDGGEGGCLVFTDPDGRRRMFVGMSYYLNSGEPSGGMIGYDCDDDGVAAREEVKTLSREESAAMEERSSPPHHEEPTTTPEDTLAAAGIGSAGQAQYQRRFSSLLAGRPVEASPRPRRRRRRTEGGA